MSLTIPNQNELQALLNTGRQRGTPPEVRLADVHPPQAQLVA